MAYVGLLCIGKTEYIFSVRQPGNNIYCGASYNVPLDIGMRGGRQFFRIRNYNDNSEPFCSFHCDFSSEIPAETESRQYLGDMTNDDVLIWPVKCYTDDAIILRGCGDEEYRYDRKEQRTELFVSE